MTLLSEPESRAKRRPKRSRLLCSLQMIFAILEARRALKRITRPKRMRIADIPPHLRRDIGLTDADPLLPRITGTDPNLTLLAYARLK